MRDSADFDDYGVTRRGKKRGKFYADEPDTYAKRDRHLPRLVAEDAHDDTDGLPEGDRWSTWDQSTPTERGPRPHPKWLVTDLAAVDAELGIMKTGKEADVYLVRRYVPGTGCFTVTPVTWRAAARGSRGLIGQRPTGARSARR